MSTLPIRYAPDPVLRRKATRVAQINARVKNLVKEMFETMYETRGVGLAAPQIGISQRIIVMGIPADESDAIDEYAFINPECIKKGGERLVDEGCLSIPGYVGKLTRSEWVKVKATNLNGKEVRLKATGLMAQALEHEIDHLNGVLYIDRMKEEGTLATLAKVDPGVAVEVTAN